MVRRISTGRFASAMGVPSNAASYAPCCPWRLWATRSTWREPQSDNWRCACPGFGSSGKARHAGFGKAVPFGLGRPSGGFPLARVGRAVSPLLILATRWCIRPAASEPPAGFPAPGRRYGPAWRTAPWPVRSDGQRVAHHVLEFGLAAGVATSILASGPTSMA